MNNRLLIIVFILFLSANFFAEPPSWYNLASRKIAYPDNLYYTGTAVGERENNESVDRALSRLNLKDVARVDLLSTVEVSVENISNMNTFASTMASNADLQMQLREVFTDQTTTKIHFDNISGIQWDIWSDPQSSEIAVFAYIQKSVLCRQMDKRIIACLSRIESLLDNAEQMIPIGQKLQARETLNPVLSLFEQVEQAQRILIATDYARDIDILQLSETKSLKSRYIDIATNLQNSINIYLSCNAQLFNLSYPMLRNEIAGCLSTLNISFTQNPLEADWVITISAFAKEHSTVTYGELSKYRVSVEASVAIKKGSTGKVVFSDGFMGQGDSTLNKEEAARKGYKRVSSKLCEIILQNIQ